VEFKVYGDPIELGKPSFGKTPKRFDAIDMAMAVPRKLVVAVVNPKMPGVPDIDQAVVTPPTITVNNAFNCHLAEDNGLQSQSLAVRDDLRVHAAFTLKNTEHRLLQRTPATLELALAAPLTLAAEIAFIHLDTPYQLVL